MRVTVFGLGYVGLSAAVVFTTVGHEVVGIDVDERKVALLREGQPPFFEPGLIEALKAAQGTGRLRFEHSVPDDLGDIMLVAVGTPSTATGEADLSQVYSVASTVVAKQRSPKVFIMKSTVPPGTGRTIEALFRDSGTKTLYVSNPEFLRQGQALQDSLNPDRIVIGASDKESFQIVRDLHQGITAPFVTTDVTSAEVIKYAANAFLATKISFINEIANLCDNVGANVTEIARGIGVDPRIGHQFLQAGIGYGGSCFPKDTLALLSVGKAVGCDMAVLNAVIEVNYRQRLLPVSRLIDALGGLKDKVIAVLGLSFKPNTDDIRSAPALTFIPALLMEGALVRATDPEAMARARTELPASVELVKDPYVCAEGADAVILATEWEVYRSLDWARMVSVMASAPVIFDGRNCLDAGAVRQTGARYFGVGIPTHGSGTVPMINEGVRTW